MTTASVSIGSGVAGRIVFTPPPGGILKVIVSSPGCALAAMIASGREVTPSAGLTVSAAVVTTKTSGPVTLTVALPVMTGGAVEVAVILCGPGVFKVTLTVVAPLS